MLILLFYERLSSKNEDPLLSTSFPSSSSTSATSSSFEQHDESRRECSVQQEEEVEKVEEEGREVCDVRLSHHELQHSSSSLPITDESNSETLISDYNQNLPIVIENVNFSIRNCEIDDDEKTKNNFSEITEI